MKTHALSFLLLSSVVLIGCSDDKKTPVTPLGDKTYTSSSLELFYNGNPMSNKTVILSQNGTKASIKVFSEFDLSQLSVSGLKGKIPGPGALPGTPLLSFDVDMSEDGKVWHFATSGETQYALFSCSGFAADSKLKLFFNDVKLKSGGVKPSVWSPASIRKNDKGEFISLPVYVDWQYDPLPEIDFDFSPLLEAIFTLPVLPVYNNTAYMSISQAINEIIKYVAFREDGNIIISYISKAGGAAQLSQTLPNGYQYIIDSPGSVKLYINPMSLIGTILVNTSGGVPESDVTIIGNGMYPSGNSESGSPSDDSQTINAILSFLKTDLGQKITSSMMELILPQISEGFPLSYRVDDSSMQLYITTEQALKFAEAIITPILEDDTLIQAIKSYIASDEFLSGFLPDVDKLLRLLPEALLRTTNFNLGLNLIPVTSSK